MTTRSACCKRRSAAAEGRDDVAAAAQRPALAGTGWLRELARYESSYREHKDPVTLGKQLSELLRRGMLAYAPREEIAGMTGDDWLIWLDRGMPLPYFHTEAGKSLLELPYRNPQDDFSDIDIDSLLTAVRMRLRLPLKESA